MNQNGIFSLDVQYNILRKKDIITNYFCSIALMPYPMDCITLP